MAEPGQIRLITKRITIRSGDTIEGLLTAASILPDAESFGAVYTLNPALDPKSLTPGREVALPAAEGGTVLSTALRDGYLVALTLDVPGKRDLLEQIGALQKISPHVASLEGARFPSASDQQRSIDNLNSTTTFLGSVRTVIQEQTRPLDPDLLWQLRMETRHLVTMLGPIAQGQRSVTEENIRSLHAIAENMRLRADRFSRVRGPGDPPERYPRVRVMVRTVGADQKIMPGMRVYYAPEALYGVANAAKPFRELSPAGEYLVEANYRIWATVGTDPRPASEILQLSVRRPAGGADLAVDLVFVPPR
jgi:hypothetical protein